MSNQTPTHITQPATSSMEAAIERNRAFAAAGGHKNAVVFPNLRLFLITCRAAGAGAQQTTPHSNQKDDHGHHCCEQHRVS